jgi:Asp-tRNA(Asn)/Glu-tRNA(Gln) amidotransferase A subunit family amidase
MGDFYADGVITSNENRNLIGYAAAFNLVHLPAISIPFGTLDGLPVGLQLGGKRFSDALLIRLSHALSQLMSASRKK